MNMRSLLIFENGVQNKKDNINIGYDGENMVLIGLSQGLINMHALVQFTSFSCKVSKVYMGITTKDIFLVIETFNLP